MDGRPWRGRDPARLGRWQVAPSTAVVRGSGAGRRPVRARAPRPRPDRAAGPGRAPRSARAGLPRRSPDRRPVRRLARASRRSRPGSPRPTTGSSSAVRRRTSSPRRPVRSFRPARCRGAARRGRAGPSTTTSGRSSSTWRPSRAGRRRPIEATFRARLRLAQDGPSGRIEELVLALAEQAGRELTLVSAVRERLLTSDELDGVGDDPSGLAPCTCVMTATIPAPRTSSAACRRGINAGVRCGSNIEEAQFVSASFRLMPWTHHGVAEGVARRRGRELSRGVGGSAPV